MLVLLILIPFVFCNSITPLVESKVINISPVKVNLKNNLLSRVTNRNETLISNPTSSQTNSSDNTLHVVISTIAIICLIIICVAMCLNGNANPLDYLLLFWVCSEIVD